MKQLIWFVAFTAMLTLTPVHAEDSDTEPRMTQELMESIIIEMSGNYKGQPGFIEFEFQGIRLAAISDTGMDRMRIIAPIAQVSELTEDQKTIMLEANFHSALDARYATSQGVLYSAFIHPLSSLTEDQVTSALTQVSNLALTFGSLYTSGTLNFGGQQEPDAADAEPTVEGTPI